MAEKKFDRVRDAWPAKSRWKVTKDFLVKVTKRERATENSRKIKAKKAAAKGEEGEASNGGGASVAGGKSDGDE